LWDNIFAGLRNSHTPYNKITLPIIVPVSQHDCIIHILAVRVLFNLEDQTQLSSWTCTSALKHFILNCSFKGSNTWKCNICIFSHEEVYWCWMWLVAASSFGLLCPFFWLILGHTLLLHFLQQYAASCLLAPTESKIPVARVGVDTIFCTTRCFVRNATQANALTHSLITKNSCKIVKIDY
jgi:hypothetical protein